MPSARDTRNRISGVESTRQITRAMQLVATSKMNRAQEAVRAARPYADKISDVLRDLSRAIPGDEGVHPLFEERRPHKVAVVVLSTNRGLCGALNTNVTRAALELAQAG
ncbi:MAG TPA: F0F1 ATP synthase subunit gamma, partial [Chloroflexota bacterium]|nr:F0F1 ATP synthase subunit gamma [Chloroflexota bacterium]